MSGHINDYAPGADLVEHTMPDDGDPAKIGTITCAVPIGRATRVDAKPAPSEHPGWLDQPLVASLPRSDQLIVARDLDMLDQYLTTPRKRFV